MNKLSYESRFELIRDQLELSRRHAARRDKESPELDALRQAVEDLTGLVADLHGVSA